MLEHYSPDEVHEAVPEYEISWQDTSGKQRFKNPLLLLDQRARIPRSDEN
ncbi:hypothetical protein ACP0HM_28250 [Escherichia coli]